MDRLFDHAPLTSSEPALPDAVAQKLLQQGNANDPNTASGTSGAAVLKE